MKMNFKGLVAILFATVLMSSCSMRLVDFTVISTKNAEIGVDRAQGKKTEGKKSYFLGMGWNIKDAIDDALENAGKEYDLLVDGVVTYTSYPFVTTMKVTGLAVSSSSLKANLGEEGYKEWLNEHEIVDPSTAELVEE